MDIGCGRGEFLELLRDNSIGATGVELGTDQYLLCREKGLNVIQQDLFTYLESLPDESLGGLFSAQVIEHLTASDQLRFVTLAYRKTQVRDRRSNLRNDQCPMCFRRNAQFLYRSHPHSPSPSRDTEIRNGDVKFSDVELRFSSPMSERKIPNSSSMATAAIAEFDRTIKS